MTKKLIPYVNRFNGDVKVVTKSGAKKLSEDYSRVEFVKNDKGQRVMRVQLAGAVADISEVETKKAASNGKRSTE